MSRWFVEHRLEWIKESLEIFGHVGRLHIMTKFDVSTAQASLDLRAAQERWPDLMRYDLSEKVYKVKELTP